jgi:hypothetical protein
MTEPSLACQIAMRERLVGDPAVTALVPTLNVFDGPTRPEMFPSIIIGTGQTVLEPLTVTRSHVRVFLDVHLWTEGDGLETVKQIAGAASKALAGRPSIDGFRVMDWIVTGTRFMRDPGTFGHGIITLEALLSEAAT